MIREKHLNKLSTAAVLTLILITLTIAGVNAQDEDIQNQLQEGAQIYEENCKVCHGEKGAGRVGATLLKDWPSIRPDLAVKNTIVNGVPGSVMPAWSTENGGPLSDEEIDSVVSYILSWETGGLELMTPMPSPTMRPPITPVPQTQGDPNNGAVLFDQNCAMCHGANGEGRVGATLDKVWISIRPDLTVGNTIRNGVEGSVMPAWSMEKGGPLAEEQINDIVAFILALSEQSGTPAFTPQPERETLPNSWAGILITVVLLAVIVGAILWLQRRK